MNSVTHENVIREKKEAVASGVVYVHVNETRSRLVRLRLLTFASSNDREGEGEDPLAAYVNRSDKVHRQTEDTP